MQRQVAMKSEEFSDELDLFNTQLSDFDIINSRILWFDWLKNKLDDRLPSDHLRIDLLFAEDVRYVNSNIYFLSSDSFNYLVAIQLCLNWSNISVEEWADKDDDIIDDVNLSVRPCYKSFPKTKNSAYSAFDEIEGDSKKRKNNDSSSSESSIEKESSDESSESYISADNSDDESLASDEKIFKGLKKPLRSVESVTNEDKEDIEHMLTEIGVNRDRINLDTLIDWIVKFHKISFDLQILLTSPHFRYLLKRVYISYAMMACPLYGSRVFDLTLLKKSGKHNKKIKRVKIVLSVGTDGMKILDAKDWKLIFQAKLWDIQNCYIGKDDSEVDEYENISNDPILSFDINDLRLDFAGEKSVFKNVIDNIDVCLLHILGHGAFPRGTESDDELLLRELLPNSIVNTSTMNEMLANQSDNKALLQKFHKFFTIIPRPPIPNSSMNKSELYFEAPKSRREVLAEEREEQANVEREMAKFSALIQEEKTQKLLKEGRKNIDKYKNQSSDDENGSDQEITTSNKKQSVRRTNRSIVSSISMRRSIDDIITTSVCGVLNSHFDESPLALDYDRITIPFIPCRIKGQIVIPSKEKGVVKSLPEFNTKGVSSNFNPFNHIRDHAVDNMHRLIKNGGKKIIDNDQKIKSFLKDYDSKVELMDQESYLVLDNTCSNNGEEIDVYMNGLNYYCKNKKHSKRVKIVSE